MIKDDKELNDVVCAAYKMGCDQTREVYQKRIEKLEAGEVEFDRVIGGYASENAQFRDRIEKLEAALRSIAANACCGSCREAALVARKALEGKDE